MQAWKEFIRSQEKVFGKETIDKWVSSLKVIKFDACNLYLEAENVMQKVFFEEHILPKLKKGFYNNNHHLIKVHISLHNEKPPSQQVELRKTEKNREEKLDPFATFSHFIPTEKNKITFKIFCELIGFPLSDIPAHENIGSFNPIFLYGKSGSGKSHLLQAAYHHLEKEKKVRYVRAEKFTEHVVEAIRLAEMDKFRAYYRDVDVLIVDNIHIFSRKSATQEEFFHTFNTLHSNGCQIILSSNIHPAQLEEIEPRLVSRFEWGITLQLEKLEKKHMKMLIMQKARSLHLPLSSDIINFLIKEFGNSTNAIQLALETILLKSHLDNQSEVSLPQVERYLKYQIEEVKKNKLSLDKIIKIVSNHYGLKIEDILGKGQTKEHAFPRQLAMYFCRSKLHLPFLQIGRAFQRDHSTVMSSVKLVEKMLLEQEKSFQSSFSEICKQLDSYPS